MSHEPGAAPADVALRPNPLRWIGYAFGGSLPHRHRSWVLYDVSTRTWLLRHAARALTQLAVPLVLIIVVLPGPFWIRGSAALCGAILGLLYSFAYAQESAENRVKKAGYPVGAAQAIRDRRTDARAANESERRRAAAARRARRYQQRLHR